MAEPTTVIEGRVTSIRAQSRAPNRVSIYIDGAFAYGIHRDILLEFDIAKGIELTAKVQREILARDAYFRARAAAFRFLSYRDRASAEIRRRLRRAEYESDVIENVVVDLEKAGYVNDEKFARTFADLRFRSGGYGPKRVRADLRRMGVSAAIVDAAIDEVFSESDELLDRAREMADKRWGQLARERDVLKRKKKVYDYLARRGFSFEMIRRVVENLENQET